jgi:hypothetical protein
MLEVAGEELQYIAFHHHYDSGLENSPLGGVEFRDEPDLAWHHLMNAHKSTQERIFQMREEVGAYPVGLALTESHFALPGRNRGEVLATWAAGVANARVLNVHARNGDILKIATLADFCGTRWMVSAIMIPTPVWRGSAFMMPVARVMALYRHHVGEDAVGVVSVPRGLDVTASRSGRRVFLHVVNTRRTEGVQAEIRIVGRRIPSGRVFQIATDPYREIDEASAELLAPQECVLPSNMSWTFPAASVTAVELDMEEDSLWPATSL